MTDPNDVDTLPYFWYGCDGTGDATIEAFLEYGGHHFGWIFTPPRGSGALITSSDQDWVARASSYVECWDLMENILTYLATHGDTPANELSWGALKSAFR